MRGDDTQRAVAGAGRSAGRQGPRHAAPKKSILTKLQIPAGKAMALAAMPTAVFVGLGFTPRLALAADAQDMPFAPGPCVTRSDEPAESAPASPPPSGSVKPGESVKPSGSVQPGEPPPVSPEPSPAVSGSAAGGGVKAPSPSGSSGDVEPADVVRTPMANAPGPGLSGSTGPTTGPAASQSTDPLDPPGLGNVLGDVLGGPGTEPSSSPTSSAPVPVSPVPVSPVPVSPVPVSPAQGSPPPAGTPADRPAATPSARPGDGHSPAGKPDNPARDTAAGRTEDAIREAAAQAGVPVAELDEDARGLEAGTDEDIPEGAQGKEPFPCPTPDPEALANAAEEPDIPLLAKDPWILESSDLALRGLTYHGIVEVRKAGDPQTLVPVLKFTAEEVDIENLHQKVVYPDGLTGHVQAAGGSTSTIRSGQVTLYVEELRGDLFSLTPVIFSPATPPPLDLPVADFTAARVVVAGQFGGTLTIPGLRSYLTG